ncbi:nucleotidyltransferase family protein [uncultured Oscillibacter sp.]|uniref:nucleotidyltransferase family protein n=1 Tax=uncultured Oscillibacter sp. TaxID=876091 RepID=UPI0025DE4CCD|nr:nucleotidyltransferase family protein [uncultured Oscillibacter sp.]
MEHNQALGCVLMAAGSARRYGENKLSAALEGRSLIVRAMESVPAEQLERVVVVTAYPEIMRLAAEFHFAAVFNHRPELGASHTIALGLTQLRDLDGVMFLVCDQPLLRRESVAALAELWRRSPDKIAALGHDGVRGNPCVFPARLFPELLRLTGDRGGSAVIRLHPELLTLLEVPERELTDVDTVQAMEALRREEES